MFRKQIFYFYIKNHQYINNWDLVDTSADKIIGQYLFDKDREFLYQWAKKKSLWQRRIAIIATFYFIKQNQFKDTLNISEILINDDHDLIHKACGWMLREVAKRDKKIVESFLCQYQLKMPRTMLRYAIERFPEEERQQFLSCHPAV